MTGTLKGVAIRPARKAPMVECASVRISAKAGLEGDHAGRNPHRLVTVLSAEAWTEACASLGTDVTLAWTLRRANLLVEGVRLPRAAGGVIAVGGAVLEITGQTYPCKRMEEARAGLLKALAQDWRGGVLCKVLEEATVTVGDPVTILSAPAEHVRRLP